MRFDCILHTVTNRTLDLCCFYLLVCNCFVSNFASASSSVSVLVASLHHAFYFLFSAPFSSSSTSLFFSFGITLVRWFYLHKLSSNLSYCIPNSLCLIAAHMHQRIKCAFAAQFRPTDRPTKSSHSLAFITRFHLFNSFAERKCPFKVFFCCPYDKMLSLVVPASHCSATAEWPTLLGNLPVSTNLRTFFLRSRSDGCIFHIA